MNSIPSPLLVTAALITVQVLFGLNYVVQKYVIGQFPPLVWASLRISVAAVMLLILIKIKNIPTPKPTRDWLWPLFGFSLLGTVINQGSFLLGLKYTSATNSAVLNTTIPIFTLLIVTLRGQERFTLRRGFGFLFALVGVLALRHIEDFKLSSQTFVGDLLTLLNCLSYAFFLSYSKPFFEKHDRLWATGWLFALGSIGLTLLALPTSAAGPGWIDFTWPEMNATLLSCMAFAIVGGTLLTYFLNNWSLAYARSSSVALWIYVQPVIAAILAWFWYGEVVTPRVMGSGALIFLGLLLGLTDSQSPTSVR